MRNPKNSLTANSHPRQTRVSDVLALRMERDRNGTGLTRSEHMRALLEGGLARSGGVATITQTIRQWLATHEQRMGDKGTDDNQHLYSLNPMPSRGQLGEWLKLLENL